MSYPLFVFYCCISTCWFYFILVGWGVAFADYADKHSQMIVSIGGCEDWYCNNNEMENRSLFFPNPLIPTFYGCWFFLQYFNSLWMPFILYFIASLFEASNIEIFWNFLTKLCLGPFVQDLLELDEFHVYASAEVEKQEAGRIRTNLNN